MKLLGQEQNKWDAHRALSALQIFTGGLCFSTQLPVGLFCSVHAVLDTQSHERHQSHKRLRFWEGFVPGVTQGGGSMELGSPGKRVLPPSSRWQLLVWLTLPLIPTSASSGQPKLAKNLIPGTQAVMPRPFNHPWQAAARRSCSLAKA